MSSRAEESYGQHGLTMADRLGVWLSQRAVQGAIPNRNDLEVLELGCGYDARQLVGLAQRVKRGIGVDFHINPEFKRLDRFTFIESSIEESLPKLEGQMVDVVLLISVLEHLADPDVVLKSVWRLLRPSGVLLVNVPTWIGKRFLEFAAFQLGLAKVEIDDHKMYYGKRDLWPILVRAGFKPSQIRLRYHKFGLNLFAVARKT